MLDQICEKRPFKTRNADEYSLADVFALFVDPNKSLVNPFEFENNIIKGRMGSGKTMYLRANYAYHQYGLVVSLLDNVNPILPIYIKLSDYQNIQEPEKIYHKILLRLIKEVIDAFMLIKNSAALANLHEGFSGLPEEIYKSQDKLGEIMKHYKKLSSLEFTEKVSSLVKTSGSIKSKIFEFLSGLENKYETEYKTKENPTIEDISDVYKTLLSAMNGKLLILFDEAGSINRSFFKSEQNSQSYFEILMNQLRTLEFARVKIAVYPQTVSDVLTETRYGDVVFLQDDILERKGFNTFIQRVQTLITKYIYNITGISLNIDDLFETETNYTPIEHLINASNGNMRRFIQLMDLTMVEYYESEKQPMKINTQIIEQALIRSAKSMEDLHSDIDKEFLSSVAKACKARSTYKFLFPNNAPNLYKFTNKSSEYNPINILDLGSGRRGTVYAFDYAFCVYKGIPTHHLKETEKIDRNRSLSSGTWINKNTTLSEALLEVLEIPGKIEGTIDYLTENKERGFIKTNDGNEYFFDRTNIIEQDKNKILHVEKNVRFFPAKIEDSLYATYLEIP